MTQDIIKQEIYQADILLGAYRKELKNCPMGHLAYAREGGKYDRYYQIIKTNGKRIRSRINSKPELVKEMARKAYLEECIFRGEQNVTLLKDTLDMLKACDAVSVIADLQKRYPSLSPLDFIQPGETKIESALKLAKSSDGFASNGISIKSFEWANSEYEKSKKAFKNAQYTSRGLRVRSKNELFIAEKLYALDIPFRYEAVIDLGGNYVAPDFSFKNNAGHLGLWSISV